MSARRFLVLQEVRRVWLFAKYLKTVRELGLKRRKTVLSLSVEQSNINNLCLYLVRKDWLKLVKC